MEKVLDNTPKDYVEMRNPCILTGTKCVERSMKYALTAILTLVVLLTGVDRSSAQTTLAVVGEKITVTGGGIFYVSGPTEIIAGSTVSVWFENEISLVIFSGEWIT